MDATQAQFEQSVGDGFASWLSAKSGKPCAYLRRADEAPDLVYSFGGAELFVEVTSAYYDGSHAELLWKSARGRADAPTQWSGVNPDKSLAEAIASRIRSKSVKRYGPNGVLLIYVPPSITSSEELEALLSSQPVPSGSPFVGVYVAGTFPVTSHSSGGYRVLPVAGSLEREA